MNEDMEWVKTREIVYRRDQNKCQILSKMPLRVTLRLVKFAPKSLLSIVDPAHVFARSTHPHMKYDPDNVILLNRFSHSSIDDMRDPITSNPISREEHDEWWKMIVGEERWERLVQKSMDTNCCKGEEEHV
jgi:hypothetical protein